MQVSGRKLNWSWHRKCDGRGRRLKGKMPADAQRHKGRGWKTKAKGRVCRPTDTENELVVAKGEGVGSGSKFFYFKRIYEQIIAYYNKRINNNKNLYLERKKLSLVSNFWHSELSL